MDDLWVPRFAGAGYLANLGELGFQTDEDFLPSALDLGYWPPKTGLRQPGIDIRAKPTLYSLPLISDVQLLFYRHYIYSGGAPASLDYDLLMSMHMSDPGLCTYGSLMRDIKGVLMM